VLEFYNDLYDKAGYARAPFWTSWFSAGPPRVGAEAARRVPARVRSAVPDIRSHRRSPVRQPASELGRARPRERIGLRYLGCRMVGSTPAHGAIQSDTYVWTPVSLVPTQTPP